MADIDDGGPAFPRNRVAEPTWNAPGGGGGPGPFVVDEGARGMSLRDWFAGQALAGMCTAAGYQGLPWASVSKHAYQAADAMLTARTQQEGEAK